MCPPPITLFIVPHNHLKSSFINRWACLTSASPTTMGAGCLLCLFPLGLGARKPPLMTLLPTKVTRPAQNSPLLGPIFVVFGGSVPTPTSGHLRRAIRLQGSHTGGLSKCYIRAQPLPLPESASLPSLLLALSPKPLPRNLLDGNLLLRICLPENPACDLLTSPP